jgi:hypothetical protein
VGQFVRTVFRPAGFPGNTADTKFSLVAGRNAQHYQLNGSGFVNGTYDAVGISGNANLLGWTSVLTGVRMTPPAPDETRRALYLKMTIANFFGNTECKLTLEGAVGLRQ